MKQVDEIKRLLLLHTKGELSESERQQLDEWAAQSAANRALYDEFTDTEQLRAAMKRVYADAEFVGQQAEYPFSTSEPPVVPIRSGSKRFYWWAAAASILVGLIVIASYFIYKTPATKSVAKVDNSVIQDVQPGGNKATLILADGSTVLLDGAANGDLAEQSGTIVKKLENGQLRYDASNSSDGASAATFNTVTTPKGGVYRIALPDGSSVWLNAASSIRFPVGFPSDYRFVEVSGEAYFEIKKDGHRPFFVKLVSSKPGSNNTLVQVLGTHFNVNAYEEKRSDITLLEGSVRVITAPGGNKLDIQDNKNRKALMAGTGTVIKPGQRALTNESNNRVVVEATNAQNAISWVEGVFYFQDAEITQVMLQLERWYDVTFVYDPAKIDMKETYKGFIPRNMPLSKVLQRLQAIGNVQFHLIGKTVRVEP